MLIIFDLDDTLIETSLCITPIKLEMALDALIEEGLTVVDHDKALEDLLALNRANSSASAALEIFLFPYPNSQKLFEKARDLVYGAMPNEIIISSVPGAKEMLKSLISSSHRVACVTNGVVGIQEEKMKKAGIDMGVFYKIIVSDHNKDKAFHYKEIVEELKFDPKEVIVCGDRIIRDLLPAKMLGYRTILMCRGRGESEQKDHECVDYYVQDLFEVENIIISQF